MSSNPRVQQSGFFAGQEQHRALMEVVGRIVTNFGATEDSLRYLHWQLLAFELADPMVKSGMPNNDMQKALASDRTKYFAKHIPLFQILQGIDKALVVPAVKAALGTNEPAIVGRWNGLNSIAKDLGNRRNEGHTRSSPIRNFTRPHYGPDRSAKAVQA